MPAIAKPKRSIKKEQGTKDLLLDTAAEILSERSRIDVTLSELGERSGMNTALVRYYFGNKNGMLMALTERTLNHAMAQLDRVQALNIPADEKLALHIKGTINTYFDYPFANRLMHSLGTIDDGKYEKEIANKFARPIMEFQRKVLKDGETQGIFRKVNPKLLSFHIAGACDYLFHNLAYLNELHGIEEVSEEIKESYGEQVSSIIIQGIRKID
jgi:AcrR family transcriptional regulator